MKNAQIANFDFTQNPVFKANVEVATAYFNAFRDNTNQAVEVAGRIAKLAPDADFVKSASAEMTTLQKDSFGRLQSANKVASDVATEQYQSLKQVTTDFFATFKS